MDRCCLCEREIGPAETMFRRVTGWEKIRSGGGANAIVLRETVDAEVACSACILVRKGEQHVHEGQMTIG